METRLMTLEQVREEMLPHVAGIGPYAEVRVVDIQEWADAIESALAPRVVTDEDAGRFHDDLMSREGSARRWENMGAYQRECWRSALEEWERSRK